MNQPHPDPASVAARAPEPIPAWWSVDLGMVVVVGLAGLLMVLFALASIRFLTADQRFEHACTGRGGLVSFADGPDRMLLRCTVHGHVVATSR